MTRRSLLAGLLAIPVLAATAGAQTTSTDPFVGTWIFKILPSEAGGDAFRAIQTFHADGTLSEVSNLLPTLTESPAQGLWRKDGNQYKAVFQLFAFDGEGATVGMVRVRGTLTLASPDELKARFAVDFLNLDGTVEADIDVADAVASRLKLDSMAAALPPATFRDELPNAQPRPAKRRWSRSR